MYCPNCGSQNADGAQICQSCGHPLAEAGAATTAAYASFGERFVAALIDGVIFFVVGIVLRIVKLQFLNGPLFWVYAIYFLGSQGATLGKQVMKIKVVRADGSPCDYGTAALREIVGKLVSAIILGIGYLFPLWDPRKQALHDKIAQTLVVKAS